MAKIAIIGAGIGGMVAAASLHQHGFDVTVYERAFELGEVGAGLQLGPNAVRVLTALGLESRLLAVASEPDETVSIRYDSGALRYREPLRGMAQERYGARYLMAHRADLHSMLVDLVPSDRVKTGYAACDTYTDGSKAIVKFDNGDSIQADIVIGADGIHSSVRTKLWGADKPRFSNQICWRAQVPSSEMPTRVGSDNEVEISSDDLVGWLGPNGHVLCYPIRSGTVTNIFAGRVSEEWVDESWAVPSSIEEMLQAYEGWNPKLLERSLKRPMFTSGAFLTATHCRVGPAAGLPYSGMRRTQ